MHDSPFDSRYQLFVQCKPVFASKGVTFSALQSHAQVSKFATARIQQQYCKKHFGKWYLYSIVPAALLALNKCKLAVPMQVPTQLMCAFERHGSVVAYTVELQSRCDFAGAHPTDVRMTTRFKEHDLTEGRTGAIHETGHSLYVQVGAALQSLHTVFSCSLNQQCEQVSV